MQKDNMHPELAALSAFIVSWLVHLAEAHHIVVSPDEYAGLVGCVMYIVQRLARMILPNNTVTVKTVDTETVIQPAVPQQQNNDKQLASAAAMTNSGPTAQW